MPVNESLTDKVSKSVVALAGRQIFSIGITVAGGILLARLLTPGEFGIYAIVAFAFNFLNLFGDVGLAASLLRQDKEPVRNEYAAIFTVQQIMVIVAVLVFWILAPWLTQLYDIAEAYKWLFRLVALSLIAASFMVIPQVQLERDLDFPKIAVVEVLQSLMFNVVAVILAWYGYGAFSLGGGMIAHTVTGVIFINIVNPWRISLRFDWKAVKEHLSFGLPYQGTKVVNAVSDALNPVLIALLFGMINAGYIQWAMILIGYLHRPISLLNRLLFPSFSRLKTDKEKLINAVNYTYVVSGFIFFGIAAVLFSFASEITYLIYTEKWLPALFILYLLIISRIFLPMSVVNGALAYALGWAKTIFYLNIIKSTFLWLSTIIFIIIFDSYIAFGYAMICAEVLHLILYVLLKKEFAALKIIKGQWLSLSAAVVTVISLFILKTYYPIENIAALIVALIIGAILYVFWSYLLYSFYKTVSNERLIGESLNFLKGMLKNKFSKTSSY